MQDDDRNEANPANGDGQPEDEPQSGEAGVPASVTFMEMMRDAAARAAGDSQAQAVQNAALQGMAPDTAVDDLELQPEKSDAEYAAAMQQQRDRRVQRRRTRRRRRTVGVLGGVIRTVIVTIAAAGLVATIFTWWTPSAFLQNDVRQELGAAIATSVVTLAPTNVPTPNWLRRIGVVSGHRGPANDPGKTCDDGLTEAEVNFNVAQLIVRNLRGLGYTVELLDEFDPRLENYEAAALVSIHANACEEYDEFISGYMISTAAARLNARGVDDLLVDCVSRHYAIASGLERIEGVTEDMSGYHTFNEIHPRTPTAIIELGYLRSNRALLTETPDVLARGVTDGILCFLEPGSLNQPPTATAVPPEGES
jgi:N-acetylmuramoyl-L-alanine amidase